MKKVPLNRDEYSDSSKRSVGYEYLDEYYKDIKYRCIKCEKKTIFSAQEQKEAYEVRKEYMWSKRIICPSCWKEMRVLKKKLEENEAHYIANKADVVKDKEFLGEWLEALKEYPKYGKNEDTARIRFVENALERT